MSATSAILNKIKLLLNLAKSPNPNEAENARAMADKLIAKHGITEEDLTSLEPKEFYGEKDKLFSTTGVVSWKQQLAVAIAHYFDCQIVQEELIPAEGSHQYVHFVYGDDDQVKDTQFVYHAFCKKIDNLVDIKCVGRGSIYVESYCEGVVESIKWNIQMYGIEVPEVRKAIKEEEKASPPTSQSITKSDNEKERPTENRINISGQTFIKDVMAYFKGVDDGKNLSLQDILELESKNQNK
jgi:hypothetical protein